MHLYTLTHTQVKWNGTTMGESESVWKRNKETEWGKKKARATKQNSNKSIVNDQDQQHWNRDTLKLNDKRFSMNNLS